MTQFKNLLCSAIIVTLAACGAHASTLATNFAEVYVDNLKPGGSYNLTETANYPMWVNYSGDTEVDLKFASVMPVAAELKSGYEAIPDPSWITVSKQTASLLPDESVTLDVTITIPNDPKYLGKKYQGYILVNSIPQKDSNSSGMSFALALKGRILFSTAKKPMTAAELKDLNRNKARQAQGVLITPERFTVIASSEETKVNITQDVPLKIINPSTEDVAVLVEAVDPQPNGVSIPRGYTKGALKDISFSKTRFTLKKDGIMNIEASASLKKNETQKLFYAVKLFFKSSSLEVVKFVKVYIN